MPWEKQFERGDVLLRALRVFWRRGYEKSSLSLLLRGMGIRKGSFYATFGSKHALFVEVLNLYIRQRFESFDALRSAKPSLDALRRHCFLVNCATERAPVDPEVREIVATTLRAHAEFYETLLDDARAKRLLPASVEAGTTASALR
jgi:TetR/AcrR family transcriptional repressor of nem operon